MKHVSFGSTLKEARISKGLDLNTVSLRLRIRPDILKAIEEADFEHIPPRGYARNMINAYAHYLGLDSNDITRRYLDEAYSHQVTVEHSHMSDNNQRRNQARASQSLNGGTSSFNRVTPARAKRKETPQGSVNRLGRVTYSLDAEDKISGGVNRTAAARMSHEAAANARPHRAHRSTQVNDRYLNAVEGRSSTPSIDISSILPYLLGAAIVVVVLFVVLNLTVCHQEEPTETIPVTSGSASVDDGSTSSSSDSSSTDSDSSTSSSTQAVTETAPTEFTLSYEVASGKSSYIEIYVDGKIAVSDDISGSKSGSYTSSGKIRFICDNISAVTLMIDDEKQTLKENSSGIYDKTFKFSSILKKWKKNHPDSSSASSTSGSSSTTSSSSAGNTSGTVSSSGTGTTSSTTTANTNSGASTSSSNASDSGSSSSEDSSSSGTLSVTGAAEGSSSSS